MCDAWSQLRRLLLASTGIVVGLLGLGCGTMRVATRDEQIISHRRQTLHAEQRSHERTLSDYRRAMADAADRDREAVDQVSHWTANLETAQRELDEIHEEMAGLDRGIITEEAIRQWEFDRTHPEEARKRQAQRPGFSDLSSPSQ